jgi:mannose-6-phosphate isomerase-like protein (cupin superfamily)
VSGKVCRVTEKTSWATAVPNHIQYRYTQMVNPQTCPGAQLEFHLGEFQPDGGRALDDVHANEDHVFYVLSGRANAKVGDSVHALQPGDALWVPKGETHNFDVTGGETFRVLVVFSPARHQ